MDEATVGALDVGGVRGAAFRHHDVSAGRPFARPVSLK